MLCSEIKKYIETGKNFDIVEYMYHSNKRCDLCNIEKVYSMFNS